MLTKSHACHSREGAAPYTCLSRCGFGRRPSSPGLTTCSRKATPATPERRRPPFIKRCGFGHRPLSFGLTRCSQMAALATPERRRPPSERLRIRPPSALPWPHEVFTKGHACHSREAAAPFKAVANSATVRSPLASRDAHEEPRLPLQRGGGPVYLFEPLRIRPPSALPWPHEVLTKCRACHSREGAGGGPCIERLRIRPPSALPLVLTERHACLPREGAAPLEQVCIRPPSALPWPHEVPHLPLQRGRGPLRAVADSASRSAHEVPRLPLQRGGGPLELLRIRQPSASPGLNKCLTKRHPCHSREAAAPLL